MAVAKSAFFLPNGRRNTRPAKRHGQRSSAYGKKRKTSFSRFLKKPTVGPAGTRPSTASPTAIQMRPASGAGTVLWKKQKGKNQSELIQRLGKPRITRSLPEKTQEPEVQGPHRKKRTTSWLTDTTSSSAGRSFGISLLPEWMPQETV